MIPFTLSIDAYTTGFQEHVTINLLKPIEYQLHRHRLFINTIAPIENKQEYFKKVIEHNASLRINFGWSFEALHQFETILKECVEQITPKYNPNVGRMVSDMRCSWLGFEPHNMYDKEVYKDLSSYSLVIYNNEIIDYQIEVVKFLTEHPVYRQHAFLRDDWYRFEIFKEIRKDKDALLEKYHYYMDSVHTIYGLKSIPRHLLEMSIGTHFMYYPDLFFELLEFSILKGEVYE